MDSQILNEDASFIQRCNNVFYFLCSFIITPSFHFAFLIAAEPAAHREWLQGLCLGWNRANLETIVVFV